MSVESAVYFYKKIAEDEAFRNQTEGLNGAQLLSFSKDHDFDFTLEELEDVCEFIESEGEELNMDALEGVVGGLVNLRDLNPIIEPFKNMPQAFHDGGKHHGWW